MEKLCIKCDKVKNLNDFGIKRSSKDGHASHCLSCRKINAKEYRQNNPEKIKKLKRDSYLRNRYSTAEYNKRYRQDNKEVIALRASQKYSEKKEEYWARNIYRKYGLTKEAYYLLLHNQDNRCKICKVHVSEIDTRLHVDHCHTSGEVRGLLCKDCNTGLGNFRDNIKYLEEAILYLLENK